MIEQKRLYYQKYLINNELGNHIFKEQQVQFDKMLSNFKQDSDWIKDVVELRKEQKMLYKKAQRKHEDDNEEQGLGTTIDGVYLTREQVEKYKMEKD